MMPALWLSGVAMLAVATEAHAQSISMRELPDHTTEASITVDVSAQEIYEVVTDYANWPRVFSDVVSVKVKRGGREDGLVRFKSRILTTTVTAQFDNVPNHTIRFVGVKGPPGAKARGEYTLTPVDGGKRTKLTARIYMDVDGAARLFVSERKIRAMRQQKLRSDIQDASRYFAHKNRSRPSS